MRTVYDLSGKTVADLLLDTNILIDALRGHEPCERYLEKLSGEGVFCSVITAAELWAGVRPQEVDELELFLSAFRLQPVDEPIARQAGLYMQQFSKSHGLLLPDALIAASARALKARLMTHNRKHFPMNDIIVASPY